MSLRLILMRHAKSNWSHPGLSDHDRPLNARGQRDAPVVGAWLREKDIVPDQILCSTARRTVETCELLGFNSDFSRVADLYHADPDVMWAELKKATGEVLLILGHNPGIAEFAGEMVAGTIAHPRFYDYPTLATLVLEFDVDRWEEVEPQSGELVMFITPHDLV